MVQVATIPLCQKIHTNAVMTTFAKLYLFCKRFLSQNRQKNTIKESEISLVVLLFNEYLVF